MSITLREQDLTDALCQLDEMVNGTFRYGNQSPSVHVGNLAHKFKDSNFLAQLLEHMHKISLSMSDPQHANFRVGLAGAILHYAPKESPLHISMKNNVPDFLALAEEQMAFPVISQYYHLIYAYINPQDLVRERFGARALKQAEQALDHLHPKAAWDMLSTCVLLLPGKSPARAYGLALRDSLNELSSHEFSLPAHELLCREQALGQFCTKEWIENTRNVAMRVSGYTL